MFERRIDYDTAWSIMGTMLTRLSRWVVVLLLVVATGGHWALLQTAAWFGMAMKYAQEAPLKVALVKTFDGRHPCMLCKVVQEGRKAEQRKTVLKVETKLDFWLTREPSTVDRPLPVVRPPVVSELAPLRPESPPTPPPRAA